jgi:hypothetical protein
MNPFLDKGTNEQGNDEFSINALTSDDVNAISDLIVSKCTEKNVLINKMQSDSTTNVSAEILMKTKNEYEQLKRLCSALTGKVYSKL